MGTAEATPGATSTLGLSDDHKRWLVFGIALNKILAPNLRPHVEQEVLREYGNVKTTHYIDKQSRYRRLQIWRWPLKYENINNNAGHPKLRDGKWNYALFNCRVTSHVDFAKLYLENYMARFSAFDEHCNISVLLLLLSGVPVFSAAVQPAASDVREGRNAWAHCDFSEWNAVMFQQRFQALVELVKALGLPSADKEKLLGDLHDWKTRGVTLCMNSPVDPDLLRLVHQHVNALEVDLDKLAFEFEKARIIVRKALQDTSTRLHKLAKRVFNLETQQKRTQEVQKDIQNRVAQLEAKSSSVSFEIASCEADIAFFAKFRDSDTRQWLLDDFKRWFSDPGDSRAYVLLGDPGVGKSVVAATLAQHHKADLGAAYFCRHYDDTRRDPRYLLGTVAHQLCNCNKEYNDRVGGEGGIQKLLGERRLGVQELFTKLLEEPLSKCNPCEKSKLVIIDALDESKHESREDFLDLIMHRFPILPGWLVFFITSRPEDSVQFRLRKYNPCVKICAGDGEHDNFYQQHQQDIKKFLEKRIDISHLSCSVEDVAEKCNGMFLYAYYIVKELKSAVQSGRTFDHVNDLFPGDIDEYFGANFKRISEIVGEDVFKKLFGCAIVAPSPLPLSFISYFLKRESSVLDEQEVVDAVSLFMVLRTSDQTLSFLHNLIPAWLTDKSKSSRRLVIDKKIAGEYLRDVFVEILSAIVSKPSSSVEVDLQDYVIRVGIRYLCQISASNDSGEGRDYLNTVFKCLSNYRFIEKRIERRRIELFTLLEDYRLAANRFAGIDSGKKDILHEVQHLLDDNTGILSECPHLLHSCLRNAPNVVRENIVIPAEVSAPWLDANTSNSQYPTAKVPIDMRCFAVSPDERLIVEGNGRCISFFDAVSLENVLGPFDLSDCVNEDVKHLEFSADCKFVFFGRLDKWFSVERRRVEGFSQFYGNSVFYEWAYFTRDRQWVVVKRPDFLAERFCDERVCLAIMFALWTAREVELSQGQMICSLNMDLLMESDDGLFSFMRQWEEDTERERMREMWEKDRAREMMIERIRERMIQMGTKRMRGMFEKDSEEKRMSEMWKDGKERERMLEMWEEDREREMVREILEEDEKTKKAREMLEEDRKREMIRALLRALDIITNGCKHDETEGRRKADANNDVFGILKSFFPRHHFCVCCQIIRSLQHQGYYHVEEPSLSTLRQCIIELYRDVFQHQVWDISSGRPVLEQVFSSGGQMSPLTYWCHLTAALDECGRLFSGVDKAILLPNIALTNAIYYVVSSRPFSSRMQCFNERVSSSSDLSFEGAFDSGSCNFMSASLEFENHCNVMCERGLLSRLQTLSPKRKWIARRDERQWTTVFIFETPSSEREGTGEPTYVINDVKCFVFASENAIVYITFRHHSLRGVSLFTGKPLTSVSGINPVHIESFGFLFRNNDEETFIPLKSISRLPGIIFSFLSAKQPRRAAFNGTGLIMSVQSAVTAVATLWRTTDDHDAVKYVSESLLVTPERKGSFHVRKCAFPPMAGYWPFIVILRCHYLALMMVQSFGARFFKQRTSSQLCGWFFQETAHYCYFVFRRLTKGSFFQCGMFRSRQTQDSWIVQAYHMWNVVVFHQITRILSSVVSMKLKSLRTLHNAIPW